MQTKAGSSMAHGLWRLGIALSESPRKARGLADRAILERRACGYLGSKGPMGDVSDEL